MADRRAADPTRPSCIIYHGPSIEPDEAHATSWRAADSLFENGPGDESALLIVDAAMLERRDKLRKLPRRVVLVAADELVRATLRDRSPISIAGLHDHAARNRVLGAACLLACARSAGVRLRRRLARQKLEARELNRIGMALMLERDRDQLLRDIVVQGKRLTGSDSGALLLIETDELEFRRLRPVFWDFDFLPELRVPPVTYPLDGTSIPGYAGLTGQTIVVDNAYDLPPSSPFQHERSLDEKFGYYTKSGLIVPMIDHRNRTVGVLALGNRKSDPSGRITNRASADRYVVRYTDREVDVARSLASQAAVSIENEQLYRHIEEMLEGFVKAAATAIDGRDPATAGHSVRVAALTAAIGMALDRTSRGKYRSFHLTHAQMRELRFAALLHDFGKIAVREDVLMKSKKLPPVLWERVSGRFELIRRTIELEAYKRATLGRSPADASTVDRRRDDELAGRLAEIDRMWKIVAAANEPTVSSEAAHAELADIATHTFARCDGEVTPYLSPEELHFLQLPYGTLDAAERAEVESHVAQTALFLSHIPWTDDLKHIGMYAGEHHEKLDGSGYPNHLSGDEIPVQARLITLADIFDALTEADRPYKPAVPVETALDMLRAEGKAGRLDADLVQIMIESGSYRAGESRDR